MVTLQEYKKPYDQRGARQSDHCHTLAEHTQNPQHNESARLVACDQSRSDQDPSISESAWLIVRYDVGMFYTLLYIVSRRPPSHSDSSVYALLSKVNSPFG